MHDANPLAANLARIQQRILQCTAGGATLIAVSKTQPASAVQALAACGQVDFGENYVQEGVDKICALQSQPQHAALVWHMIGPLQSNKTKPVAEHFDWVHTVDRLKIAQRLSDQRPAHLPPLNVLLQVNIDNEASKNGVTPEDALALAHAVASLPRLRLRGLMCIPKAAGGDGFARMRALFDAVRAQGLGIDALSMGMSGDFEAALSHGATHVRVGTAIFGARTYN